MPVTCVSQSFQSDQRLPFQMLNLLGIPKAILENVVFCHQENSTWLDFFLNMLLTEKY